MTDIHGKVTARQKIGGMVETTSAVNGEINKQSDNEEKDVISDIHGRISTNQNIDGRIKSTSAINGSINIGSDKDRVIKDYNLLYNKPSINGVELKGNKTSEELGIPTVLTDTTEYWNSQVGMIGKKDVIYIYTDHSHDDKGNDVPGIKIGDGQAYLIDTPFLDVNCQSHINNTEIHITQAERDFWNSNKSNIYCNTTAYWESLPSLQSEKNAIYVYTDHQHLDEKDIPGMKIGDGNAYLIDLPFVDAVYAKHIANSIIHVTQEDRMIWDNNVTCFIAPNKDDRLVFRNRQNL